MVISLRLTEEEATLIRSYAELKKVSVSELIWQTVLERIEDEYDLIAYEKAIEEYRDHPLTFSQKEAVKILSNE
jgi:uncharacterized protein (DUF1778 family)